MRMKQEIMVKSKGAKYYFIKTKEALELERKRDLESGWFLNSDGESKLYSHVGVDYFPEDTPVLITKKSKIEWPCWRKKPKHLRQGLATIDGVPMIIMFIRDGARS